MPATEIITIINNSGKVLSTGKQLVNIFKEAKAAYRDKRETIKAERAGIQRSKTFDVTPRGPSDRFYEDEDEIDNVYNHRTLRDRDGSDRRRSQDDVRSQASSHRSHRSRWPRPRSSSRPRPALTETNLREHSEVSATPPSVVPNTYRSPYAETAPRDMQLSRPNLTHAATMPLPRRSGGALIPTTTTTPVSTPRQSMLVHRPRSDGSGKKDIDMHLAYGELPPDLATRADLEPAHRKASPEPNEQEAQAIGMIDRIEGFLEEAHCIHHTASSMIAHLQKNPEAAAAVALTLAELSALIGKMSPAFLGVIKGGSPAIFALLASPQFLIGTSIALGVTVVIFGGWKIVKRMREANKEKEQPIEMQPMAAGAREADVPAQPSGTSSASYEEALVIEEELSTIETWRRGIQPFGNAESADIELMSAEAERALREKYRDEEVDPDDSVSRSGRSTRSHRTSGTRRSHRSRRHHRSHEEDDVEIPERKSSKKYHKDDKDREGAYSEVAESERSHRSHRSHARSSKHTAKVGPKAIDDGGRADDDSLDNVLKPKEKKNNMLRQLFKKMKDKEEKEKAGKAMSVLV